MMHCCRVATSYVKVAESCILVHIKPPVRLNDTGVAAIAWHQQFFMTAALVVRHRTRWLHVAVPSLRERNGLIGVFGSDQQRNRPEQFFAVIFFFTGIQFDHYRCSGARIFELWICYGLLSLSNNLPSFSASITRSHVFILHCTEHKGPAFDYQPGRDLRNKFWRSHERNFPRRRINTARDVKILCAVHIWPL